MDGTVQVTHPDLSIGVYPLNRLTQLYDGMEHLENDIWGESEDDNEEEEKSLWTLDESGVWLPTVDEGDWEDIPDEEVNVQGNVGITQDLHDENTDMDVDKVTKPLPRILPSSMSPPDLSTQITIESEEESSDFWTSFKIISSAPVDHAFYSSSPAQPSRSFLARLRKEYRVLDNSLPGLH